MGKQMASNESPLVRSLTWRKSAKGWRLFAGKRRFGSVIPDSKYPGMWRVPLSDGRLSDMANMSWARNAVLATAVREIEYEARLTPVIEALNSQQIGGVSEVASSHSDLKGRKVS